MGDALIVRTKALQKTYDNGTEALRGLDLEVPPGSICGFLGPNGAGKTTTLKILLGMTRPGGGDARVFGHDARDERGSLEIRRRTGFVDAGKELYGGLTVGEIVRFTSRFFPGWRRDVEQQYLRAFNLPVDSRIKALSTGMRTKLSVLLALARGAELLILDEPTAGLDPAAAEEVLQLLVSDVAARGTTVLFSTHQIADVDQIADRVVIIDGGRHVVSGGIDDVRSAYRRIHIVFDGDAPAVTWRSPGVAHARRQGRVLSVLSAGSTEALLAEARALDPSSIEVLPVTLKELFLDVTGGSQ